MALESSERRYRYTQPSRKVPQADRRCVDRVIEARRRAHMPRQSEEDQGDALRAGLAGAGLAGAWDWPTRFTATTSASPARRTWTVALASRRRAITRSVS